MAIHDKWDIGTTAIKGQLDGAKVQMEDDSWLTVEDWYIDFQTGMINIVFVGETIARSFRLGSKFIVDIPESITPIKEKKISKQKKMSEIKKYIDPNRIKNRRLLIG